MPYPAILRGCRFFEKRIEETNRCAAGEFGGEGGCKPSTVGSRGEGPENLGYFAF